MAARQYAATLAAVPRGIDPIIPSAATAKLKFSQFGALPASATTGWTFGTPVNLRVNNAYEPILATHQPYGWDQMAAFYRKYKVTGFAVKITFLNTQSQAGFAVVRPVPVDENFSVFGEYPDRVAEVPNAHVIPLPTANAPVVTYSHRADIPRLLGVSKEQFDASVDDTYAASVTAAPARYAYVQIAFASNGTSDSCRYLIEAEYTVDFWQRKTQSQS